MEFCGRLHHRTGRLPAQPVPNRGEKCGDCSRNTHTYTHNTSSNMKHENCIPQASLHPASQRPTVHRFIRRKFKNRPGNAGNDRNGNGFVLFSFSGFPGTAGTHCHSTCPVLPGGGGRRIYDVFLPCSATPILTPEVSAKMMLGEEGSRMKGWRSGELFSHPSVLSNSIYVSSR